ncbi:endonuclease/exonuclease/phosphatase family protein [Myxococcota bacterium]|nr:endonuclease/exonuclease/phosphatase family protein [Myxococcota bacterium]MBU1537724.1 endonuclease/exonuclease/phosphatase family protein [Myxococcota bacterium]
MKKNGISIRFVIVSRLIVALMAIVIFLPSQAMAGNCNQNGKKKNIKVMTRNLYLGADIFKVVEAAMTSSDPYAVPMAVTEVFGVVQYTNFPERAQALADEILENNPQMVGLQEVTSYLMQTPGDFLYGNPEPATTTVIDFLTVLQQALAARGLHYNVAAVNHNADIELPMFSGFTPEGYPIVSDLRMVDSDVILVRHDVHASNVFNYNFTYNVAMDLSGVNVQFTRGFSAIDARIGGETYRFVNVHLETGLDVGEAFAMIQAVQMMELLSILSMETLPIILVGDLNSSPADPISQPYHQALAAGFTDAWLDKNASNPGFTCCFDEYVSDPTAALTMRIDHVFIMPTGKSIKHINTWRVGEDVVDMTPSGLRPSDHAGVVAHIHFR